VPSQPNAGNKASDFSVRFLVETSGLGMKIAANL
jgi:hypothetical protein